MNIKNAQLDVDNWIKNHGVRYFNELTNMAQLTEEVGEVARIISRRYGEQSEKERQDQKTKLLDILNIKSEHFEKQKPKANALMDIRIGFPVEWIPQCHFHCHCQAISSRKIVRHKMYSLFNDCFSLLLGKL